MHPSPHEKKSRTDVPESWKSRAAETAAFLKNRIGRIPRTGLLIGTGLGEAVAALNVDTAFPYRVIPHFPLSTVQGHAGQLLFGDLAGRAVMAMQGRFHLYEGYSPAQVAFPIRVMQELGVHRLILTNAAGGLNPSFAPADMMLISDHLNLTGKNPLLGPNEESWGPRFPDMSCAYDPGLIRCAETAAARNGLAIRKGVYVGLTGPALETPAETRFLKMIGAEAVGFSTIQESIAAVHGGMKVLGLSVITNLNDPDHPVPASVDEIIAVARRAAPELGKLLTQIMRQLDDRPLG